MGDTIFSFGPQGLERWVVTLVSTRVVRAMPFGATEKWRERGWSLTATPLSHHTAAFPASPELLARVHAIADLCERHGVTLPQAAVVLREGFTYVFRLEGEGSETATNTATATAAATAKVALTKVGTGRRLGERIEVAGLAPDARVVASGAGFLADGDTVRLVAPETAAVTPAASATKAAP